jgi:UDP-N-acetyl-D-glucosamine/UDP-N-acetyl-D-galactosamine dehydrogenase
VIKEFRSYHAKVDVYDPWINLDEAKLEYGIESVQTLEQGNYDAIILTVSQPISRYRNRKDPHIRQA